MTIDSASSDSSSLKGQTAEVAELSGVRAWATVVLVLVICALIAVVKISVYYLAILSFVSKLGVGGHPSWLMAWVSISVLLILAAAIVYAADTVRSVASGEFSSEATMLACEFNEPLEWLRRLGSLVVIPLAVSVLTRHGWSDTAGYVFAIAGWCCHDLSTLLLCFLRRRAHQPE